MNRHRNHEYAPSSSKPVADAEKALAEKPPRLPLPTPAPPTTKPDPCAVISLPVSATFGGETLVDEANGLAHLLQRQRLAAGLLAVRAEARAASAGGQHHVSYSLRLKYGKIFIGKLHGEWLVDRNSLNSSITVDGH